MPICDCASEFSLGRGFLADVYDALACKRAYKDALSHHLARSIILEGFNSHFDPEVVAAFLQIEGEFLTIREKFSDDEGTIRMHEPNALTR